MSDSAEHKEEAHSSAHGAPHGGGHEEHHEGAPEWLISFADNVALMMGFFVILLAMNMAKPSMGGVGGQEKNHGGGDSPAMQDFVIAMRQAFGNPVNPNSSDPKEAPLRERIRQRQTIGSTMDPSPDGNKHSVQSTKTTDWVAPFGTIPFPTNQQSLSDNARTLIVQVAEQIRGRRAIVEVRGHTSAAEADRDTLHARELSYKRALEVAQVLADNGVRWNQIRLVSCGDAFPLLGRAGNAEEHRTNERAEIVMTQETMPPDQFTADAPPPTANSDERPEH